MICDDAVLSQHACDDNLSIWNTLAQFFQRWHHRYSFFLTITKNTYPPPSWQFIRYSFLYSVMFIINSWQRRYRLPQLRSESWTHLFSFYILIWRRSPQRLNINEFIPFKSLLPNTLQGQNIKNPSFGVGLYKARSTIGWPKYGSWCR
jgi:hypothetical protein